MDTVNRAWRLCAWGGLLVAAAGCQEPRSAPTTPAEREEIPILWEHAGSASFIARPLRVVARDEATLAQVPVADVPVDWRTQMVLIAANGPVASDQIGIRIDRVWREGNRIRVQVHVLHPGDEKHGTVVQTSPYHIVIVPRSDLNVDGFSADVPRGAVRMPAVPGAHTRRESP